MSQKLRRLYLCVCVRAAVRVFVCVLRALIVTLVNLPLYIIHIVIGRKSAAASATRQIFSLSLSYTLSALSCASVCNVERSGKTIFTNYQFSSSRLISLLLLSCCSARLLPKHTLRPLFLYASTFSIHCCIHHLYMHFGVISRTYFCN